VKTPSASPKAAAKPDSVAKTSEAPKTAASKAVPAAPKPAGAGAPAVRVPAPPPNAGLTSVPSSLAVMPVKGGRASRLAQITVPSMAQAVASTAAKASYLQEIPAPMIAPSSPIAAKKDPKLANNWKAKSAEELTDQEVLAMPDSEYMNDKQMAFFRLKLQQLKLEILNSAGETTEHLREDTVVVPDPADRATIEEEHALELRTRDRERKLLKKIEQSIVRIDAGDYGYCDETGEPIGVGRLLARPTATLSLEAQQRRELKQKMFGD
jgi:DnaK suppressor protein